MPNWLPEAASTFAGDIDRLMIFITIVVGVWFVAAELYLVYSALRFRRRKGVRAAYLPGRTLRAMSVILIPCAVVLCLDLVIEAVGAPVWYKIKESIPEHQQLVRITGQQWAWGFTLSGPDGELDTEDDIEITNELHVPVGEVVRFELTAKDVLHSFSVAEFRLKQDAVPGRRINGWFEATKPGEFEIICAEICGFGHTLMKAKMVAESPEAYRQWVETKIQEKASAQKEESKEG